MPDQIFAAPSERIFRIDSVSIGLPREPGKLTLCVRGTARTPGYRKLRLEPLGQSPAEPGIFNFAFVGEAPEGLVAQVLTEVSLTYEWTDVPVGITAIRVSGATNAFVVPSDQPGQDCNGTKTGDADASSPDALLGKIWLAEDISGAGVIDNLQTTIQFLPDGQAYGGGGRNRFRTKYQLAAGSLTFGPVASTRKMCPPAIMNQETAFFRSLERVTGFRREGTVLYFTDATGRDVLRFTPLAR